MNDQDELLETLRTTVHRDFEDDTASLVPPSAVIGMVAGRSEEAALGVYCITYGYLLRRLMRGMDQDEVAGLAESYLGMQPAGVQQQFADMRRVCGYADRLLAKTISREQAIAQMMTWKNADKRMVNGLLDETLAVYRFENRTSYTPPESDGMMPDGDVRNDSFSTNAPHVTLDFKRLVRYDPMIGGMVRLFRRLTAVFVLVLLGDIALFATGHWIIGLLLLPLLWWGRRFPLMLRHIPLIKEAMTQLFQNALLTPGIVENVEPLTIVCLAQMGNSGTKDYWGLKRLEIKALPFTTLRRGEIFPCVSGFQRGDADDHWVDFDARPICWGTDDELKIKDLMMKLDPPEVEHLKRLLKKGPLPISEKVLILDENFAPLRPS